MTECWPHIKDLLDRALDHDPETRTDFLDRACAGDDTLRAEVQSLLEAYSEGASFFDRSPASSHPPSSTGLGPSLRGERVGPYRLLDELGRGGMSIVYLAERADGQFDQRVALKLLPDRFQSEHRIARFRAERQILADLDHPNIAQLLDGGVTEEGRPYLVMEHVEGLPITTYCEERQLFIEERLTLFQTVCAAVQHAHRSLVVHRDLKPSNILVTGEGRVKLLDFGIAKLLDEHAALTVPITRTGERLLTPEYAAPEQVRDEPITTATDVYQLGVLAYQLLTGRHPIAVESSSFIAVERAVLETAPEKPSTAVQEADDAFTLSPEAMRKRLRGDLDTIVLKALRKEPERRYESAGALAADIDHYLKDQPVAARPATVRYRIRKFVSRHRWETISMVAVAVLLIGSIAVLWRQRAQTLRERNRARIEAEKAAHTARFLRSLFQQVDPTQTADEAKRQAALRLLDDGRRRLAELDDTPSIQIDLLHTVGRLYMNLGAYRTADSLLHQALGRLRQLSAVPPLTQARVHQAHGEVLYFRGYRDSTRQLVRRAYRIHQSRSRVDSALYARHLNWIAITAGADSVETFATNARRFLTTLYGPRSSELAHFLEFLARGHPDEQRASALFREALAIYAKREGTHTPQFAKVLNDYALHIGRVNPDSAAHMLAHAYRIYRDVYGPDHRQTRAVFYNLAATRFDQGRYDAARSLLQQVLEQRRRTMPGEVGVAFPLYYLGRTCRQLGRLKQAAAYFQEALELLETTMAPHNRRVLLTRYYLARTRIDQRRYRQAEQLLQRNYAERDQAKKGGIDRTREGFVALYTAWGKPEQAARYRALLEN